MIRNARRNPRDTRIRFVLPVAAIRVGDGEMGCGPADEGVQEDGRGGRGGKEGLEEFVSFGFAEDGDDGCETVDEVLEGAGISRDEKEGGGGDVRRGASEHAPIARTAARPLLARHPYDPMRQGVVQASHARCE